MRQKKTYSWKQHGPPLKGIDKCHSAVLCNREHVDCSLLPCMHVCVCVCLLLVVVALTRAVFPQFSGL